MSYTAIVVSFDLSDRLLESWDSRSIPTVVKMRSFTLQTFQILGSAIGHARSSLNHLLVIELAIRKLCLAKYCQYHLCHDHCSDRTLP